MRVLELPMDDPRSASLIEEIQDLYVQLYGGTDSTPVTACEFAPPGGSFLVGTVGAVGSFGGDISVGCIGIRRHTTDVAEIKRMYVRPAHRRRGHARDLLVAAEDRARELGYAALVLETGVHQPEAIALYQAHGYRPIPASGHYSGSPLNRSFRREL